MSFFISRSLRLRSFARRYFNQRLFAMVQVEIVTDFLEIPYRICGRYGRFEVVFSNGESKWYRYMIRSLSAVIDSVVNRMECAADIKDVRLFAWDNSCLYHWCRC